MESWNKFEAEIRVAWVAWIHGSCGLRDLRPEGSSRDPQAMSSVTTINSNADDFLLLWIDNHSNLSYIHFLRRFYTPTIYVHEETKGWALHIWLQIYLSSCSSCYIYLFQTTVSITWRCSTARWLCITTVGVLSGHWRIFEPERSDTGG